MNSTPLTDSKEVGLAIGHIVGENFFQMRDLHYGYWPADLPVNLFNFGQAQENYSRFLMSHIPAGTQRVLDVGSGAGKLAARLIQNGMQVECVSPSSYLTTQIKQNLGAQVGIHRCKFEELSTDKKFDLVLFSESFQYVNPQEALRKAADVLPAGKYAIISDFFKRKVPGDSPLGGGHEIDAFLELLEDSPFKIVTDLDITAQTAPTMEMFGEVLNQVGLPVRDLVCQFIQHRHPFISKFLAWKLKRRFDKINHKYFSGRLNGKSFSDFKVYRFFVLQKLETT